MTLSLQLPHFLDLCFEASFFVYHYQKEQTLLKPLSLPVFLFLLNRGFLSFGFSFFVLRVVHISFDACFS